jgi:endo-1,4-beta-D-glucanase Y
MTIVPLMAGYDPDAQAIFDGLWEFVRAHPSEIDPRLMDWNIPLAEGNASAFDGDADIAFGLLLADAQWGSSGAVDYLSEANTLIAAILQTTIGPDSRLPMLGDWVDPQGAVHNQYTPRSSDFMLANFAAFGRASGDPAWGAVIAQSQAVILQIQAGYSPLTGLLPDFIQGDAEGFRPASPGFLEADRDGAYSYNAGRVPWRLGLHALADDDPASRASARTISDWIQDAAGNDPAGIRAGYELTGEPRPDSDYFTSFFASPFGVAAMSDPTQHDWLNSIYAAVVDSREDYYEDSVTLICLLIMTGNHWIP